MALSSQDKKAREAQRELVRNTEARIRTLQMQAAPQAAIDRERALLAEARVKLWSMPA